MPTPPEISILLPTLDGAPDLLRLLPALGSQTRYGDCELLATDSSSGDETVALLEAAGAHVETIPRAEFGHGTTRNALAARARGDLLVFLSQDVVPATTTFLEELIAPFEDPRVAGCYGRILPFPGDDPLTARTVLHAPEAGDEPLSRDLDSSGRVWDLEPRHRAEYLRFNNVASAVRASVFAEIPFPEVPFGEDFAWAARVLSAGHRLRFAPKSIVHHAHAYTLRQAFERYRIDAAFHREIHGYRLRPSLLSVIRGVCYEVREDARYVFGEWDGPRLRHLLRSPALRSAQVLGQYWGSRGWGRSFWPEGR